MGEEGEVGGRTGHGGVQPGANRFPAALKGLPALVPQNGVRFHLWQISQTEN